MMAATTIGDGGSSGKMLNDDDLIEHFGKLILAERLLCPRAPQQKEESYGFNDDDERSEEEQLEALLDLRTLRSAWKNGNPVTIEFHVDGDDGRRQLLEIWTLTFLMDASLPPATPPHRISEGRRSSSGQDSHNSGGSGGPPNSTSTLTRAVKSHLHFSRLNAWILNSRGTLREAIKGAVQEQFSQKSDFRAAFCSRPYQMHDFEPLHLAQHGALQLTVCSLKSLPSSLPGSLSYEIHNICPKPLRSTKPLSRAPSPVDLSPAKPLHKLDRSEQKQQGFSSFGDRILGDDHLSSSDLLFTDEGKDATSPPYYSHHHPHLHHRHLDEKEETILYHPHMGLPGSPDPRRKDKDNLLRDYRHNLLHQTTSKPITIRQGTSSRHTGPLSPPYRPSSLSRSADDTSFSSSSSSSSLYRSNSMNDRISPSPSRISPSPSRLLGTFEESLLGGRFPVGQQGGAINGFNVDIGASGEGMCPPHVKLPLFARFYTVSGDYSSGPTPYVGYVDLEDGLQDNKPRGHYRVPRSGIIQVVVSNPEKTGVKLFLVKYDFNDMPPRTKTFIRQKTMMQVPVSPSTTKGLVRSVSNGNPPLKLQQQAAGKKKKKRLKDAIHLKFVSSKSGKVYLYQDIRLVFSHLVLDSSEKLTETWVEGPLQPKYSPIKSKRRQQQHTSSPHQSFYL